MKKVLLAVAAAALTLGIVPAVFAQDMSIQKVCLVTDTGNLNDGGFNQYANEGMLQAAEEYELDTDAIETKDVADYAKNIDTCIQGGANVIVTVGFMLGDATLTAATANTDIYFIGVDQFVFEGPANYVGIQFREDQAAFLVGVLAGLLSDQEGYDTVAGVYGPAIPPVVKLRNGYEQGVKYINPDIKVLGVYLEDFNSEDKGSAAADQLIGEGASIVFGAGGKTGNGGIKEGAKQGVYVIGVDQDQYFTVFDSGALEGSEYLITSAVKNVNVGVYDMIVALEEGDMTAFVGGGNYILDINNGGVGFAEKHDADLSDDLYAAVADVEALLMDGSVETGVDPATGELLDMMAEATATP